MPGKQQVVTYNFEGYTPPPDQIEEVKQMQKPVSNQQPQDIKPAKPEVIQDKEQENGGQKSARGKGEKKTHKKKIYNYWIVRLVRALIAWIWMIPHVHCELRKRLFTTEITKVNLKEKG